jgi:alpha-D-xyloside xylohydrolase
MVWDGLKEEGEEDVVSLVRSAWTGSQKYGALVWSGDIESTFDSLKNQVQAGINMGICGFPWWTTDTGGFMHGDVDDPRFHELLVRWFQYSVFCPVLRMHGDRMSSKHVPDGKRYFPPNEIWSYGEEVYGILKKYVDLRESIKDYVKEKMDEASANGSPLIRAMFYEFPNDCECWKLSTQYMFGDKYLVAPILEAGAIEREVYLPVGEWKNIHNGEIISGGKYITANAPIDIIPVYEKI